jgi:23S rRNA G2069 N7-methylase RlmK/C1962 C5-methylase RlmI
MSGVWNMSGMNLDTDTSPLGPKAWALQIQKNEAEKIIREAKERAEARVKARQLRLKVTEDHDRQIDRHLFAEGPDPIPIDIFGGKTLFQWQDMTGDQNYVLQQLSTLIAKTWDQQKLDEVEQLICNMDWIRAPYSGHPVVS